MLPSGGSICGRVTSDLPHRSLGVVVYNLIEGKYPFGMEILDKSNRSTINRKICSGSES
jgi:hypothetical protein